MIEVVHIAFIEEVLTIAQPSDQTRHPIPSSHLYCQLCLCGDDSYIGQMSHCFCHHGFPLLNGKIALLLMIKEDADIQAIKQATSPLYQIQVSQGHWVK